MGDAQSSRVIVTRDAVARQRAMSDEGAALTGGASAARHAAETSVRKRNRGCVMEPMAIRADEVEQAPCLETRFIPASPAAALGFAAKASQKDA